MESFNQGAGSSSDPRELIAGASDVERRLIAGDHNDFRIPLVTDERHVKSLQVVYEQTVQTLRNWDTIFANLASSTLIGGGVTIASTLIVRFTTSAALSHGNVLISVKVALLSVASLLYFLIMVYGAYNKKIASRKKAVLAGIERALGMPDQYGQLGGKASAIAKNAAWIATAIWVIVVLACLFSPWR
ncbi:MAG: hypothetical protein ACO1SV_11405 [Fimbriimonas sp.]